MTSTVSGRRGQGTEPLPDGPWVLWSLVRLARIRPFLFGRHAAIVLSGGYITPFLPGLLVGAVLDRLAVPGPDDGIALLLWLFGLVVLVRSATSFIQPFSTRTMMVTAEVLLRRNVLARVLRRPGARALPASPGEALVRLQDDPAVVSYGLDYLIDPLGLVVGFGLALGVLLTANPATTLAVVVPAVLVMATARQITPRIDRARKQRQEAHGRVSAMLGDAFSSVQSIQAAGAGPRVAARLDVLNDGHRRAALRDLLVAELVTGIGANVVAAAVGVAMLLSAVGPPAFRLSAGELALFASYLPVLSMITGFLGQLISVLRQSAVSIERMAEIAQGGGAAGLVEATPTHLTGPVPAPAVPRRRGPSDALELLEVRGLTFRHEGSGRGIDGIDLDVRRGELVVVTGEIGSGKTTLVRTLLGLLPATAGEVRWNGSVIEDLGAWFVPPRCASVSQVPRLFSASLRENVLLGLDADEDEVAAAARAAVLDADLEELPDGWETPVGPRGVRLSGGQVQRTAAARMFVRDPALLVVDDLSSALDVVTEQRLWDRLFARSGTTCLAVSHRPALLGRADRVVHLADGRVTSRQS